MCDELARVLKPTGSMWLNLGDSFSRHQRYGAAPKSMLLAPERVLLALSQRGWIVRSKVVWTKPNPMPTSVGDRLSCTWEPVYLLVRSGRYFFDLDAIREPHRSHRTASQPARRGKYDRPHATWAGPLAGNNDGLARARAEGRAGHPLGKNPGDVWQVPTAGFRGAHFATFPPRLVQRPVLATCPSRVCDRCGEPWRQQRGTATAPACQCGSSSYQRGLVLDPFMGAGTTAVVATEHQRDWLGIELNPTYRTLALARIANGAVRARTNPGGDARPTGAPHASTHRTTRRNRHRTPTPV